MRPSSVARTAERTSPMRKVAVPSIVFRTTLPVKPSVTTTSRAPPGMSRPSTLPTKPGVSRRSAWAASTCSLPLPSSSPIDSRPTRGLGDAEDVAREQAPHQGELREVLGPGLGARARVEQHDPAARRSSGSTTAIAGRMTPGTRRM